VRVACSHVGGAHRSRALLLPHLLQAARIPNLQRPVRLRYGQVRAFRVPSQGSGVGANVVGLRHTGLILDVNMDNGQAGVVSCCCQAGAIWAERERSDSELEGGCDVYELQCFVGLVQLQADRSEDMSVTLSHSSELTHQRIATLANIQCVSTTGKAALGASPPPCSHRPLP
jgi:hypothetical protein